MTTDEQFINGAFDPNAQVNDEVVNSSTAYPTLSTGIFYALKEGRNEIGFAGISVFHFTRPNVSLTDTKDRLPISFKATAGYLVFQNKSIGILPNLRLVNQAGNNFLNLGSRVNFTINSDKIELGLWYNTNNLEVLSAGYEHSDFKLAVGYDFPLGRAIVTGTNGTFELALSYRFKKIGTLLELNDINYSNIIKTGKVRSKKRKRKRR